MPLVLVPALLAGSARRLRRRRRVCGARSDAVAVVGAHTITKAQFDELMARRKGELQGPRAGVPEGRHDRLRARSKTRRSAISSRRPSSSRRRRSSASPSPRRRSRLASSRSSSSTSAAARRSSSRRAEEERRDARRSTRELQSRARCSRSRSTTKVDSRHQGHEGGGEELLHVAHVDLQGRRRRGTSGTSSSRPRSSRTQLDTQLKNGATSPRSRRSTRPTRARRRKAASSASRTATAPAVCADVAPFDKASFSLKTDEISQPVTRQYGWHIIQALGPHQAAHTPPFAQRRRPRSSHAAPDEAADRMQDWVDKLQKDYQGQDRLPDRLQAGDDRRDDDDAPATLR